MIGSFPNITTSHTWSSGRRRRPRTTSRPSVLRLPTTKRITQAPGCFAYWSTLVARSTEPWLDSHTDGRGLNSPSSISTYKRRPMGLDDMRVSSTQKTGMGTRLGNIAVVGDTAKSSAVLIKRSGWWGSFCERISGGDAVQRW